MKLYTGIDLHSTNSFIGIMDEKMNRITKQKVQNSAENILRVLEPYKNDMEMVAVESTYNWYWLVDALQAAGYRVKLANPAAMKQYAGIKYLNDEHDAFWLAHMLVLGILPEGYIYPREERGMRDLLRQRSYLVVQKTSLKMRLQQFYANNKGVSLRNNTIEKMTEDEIEPAFTDESVHETARSIWQTMTLIDRQIKKLESYLLREMKGEIIYRTLLSAPGIGKALGWTIALETGPIERFATAGNYASYCRCVPSSYWSNEKKKGKGNEKNGNKYLSWAYGEASHFCIQFCEEAKRYYQRKLSKSNQPKAYRAVANKLSKAFYFMMRDGVPFEAQRLFGT